MTVLSNPRPLLAVLLTMLPGLAAPGVWATRDLKPGMVGTGRTVLRGTTIETFNVEILDILESDGFTTDLILIRLGGPVIDRTGGIAAGMSGSPLYIDGKLFGAVAFTTPFSDTRVGYATPIEDMLQLFELEPRAVGSGPRRLLPAGGVVLAGGLRGRALAAAERWLGRRGARVLPVAQPRGEPPADQPADTVLGEGSAVAVSLTSGDVSMTALGTVSYRDGDRILAFGHPFLQRGTTSMFLSEAWVYDVVTSVDMPFKIGAPLGSPVGSVTQDRAAGLGGRIGQPTDSFKVIVDAEDTTLGRRRRLNVDLIRDVELAPSLAAVCVMQAMDEVMDRAGGGTATVRWTIEAEGLDGPLRREDMHFSGDDLIGAVIPGPLFCLDALLRNDFAELRPTTVTIQITCDQQRRTTRVIDCAVEPRRARPGETLVLTATLQPWRGPAEQRELRLTVPADQPPGPLLVDLHGCPRAPGPLSQAAWLAAGVAPPRGLRELVGALEQSQRGDVLLAELLTPEAADARDRARARLLELPAADVFPGDDPATLPSLEFDLGGGAVAALSTAEARLPQVVLGRLRQSVTVTAP